MQTGNIEDERRQSYSHQECVERHSVLRSLQ